MLFVRQQVEDVVTRWDMSQRDAPLVSFLIEHQELVSSERDVVILKNVHVCKNGIFSAFSVQILNAERDDGLSGGPLPSEQKGTVGQVETVGRSLGQDQGGELQ